MKPAEPRLHLLVPGFWVVLLAVGCQPYGHATMFPGVDCIQCHSAAASLIPGSCASTVTPSIQLADGGFLETGPFCNGSALQWTAAGTILSDPLADPDGGGVPNVHILLQDALGKRVNLTSNSVGNFFTQEPLQFGPVPDGDGGVSYFTVQIEYQGECLQMTTHPTPSEEYPSTSNIAGVGCNRCHTIEPDYADGGPLVVPGRVITPGYLSVPQGPNLMYVPNGIDPCDGGFWGATSSLP